VKRAFVLPLLLFAFAAFSLADQVSFRRIQVPDSKGRPAKGVLTFSDASKSLEVRSTKGTSITLPFTQIDKFTYEYTKKHRVSEETIATAPIGIGAVAMLTKSRSHWLEIHYREQDVLKEYVLRMDKHEYLRILEAVKKYTGKDAEVLGNAEKR
jgi:hypothetical protein